VQHGAVRGVPVCKLAVRGTRVLEHTSARSRTWMRHATVGSASLVAMLLAAAPVLGTNSRAIHPAWAWAWAPAGIVLAVLTASAIRYALVHSPGQWLRVLGDEIILQVGARTEFVIDIAEPIGVTLLANAARNRLLVGITNRQHAAYFAATIEGGPRSTHRDLLVRANTLSDDEVSGSPFADGAPIELASGDLAILLDVLARRDPTCFERCFLSDTHGHSVVLDSHELVVGHRRFDLHSPLEWRATVFQEPFGSAVLDEDDAQPGASGGVMVYQGTWLQQGLNEVVLVSLLASLTAAAPPPAEAPEAASLLARDLRLMQAAPEEPPPRELRVGIERVFMLRLRAAVDRAPRASRHERPSGASMR